MHWVRARTARFVARRYIARFAARRVSEASPAWWQTLMSPFIVLIALPRPGPLGEAQLGPRRVFVWTCRLGAEAVRISPLKLDRSNSAATDP
jgi:hypothetical protein